MFRLYCNQCLRRQFPKTSSILLRKSRKLIYQTNKENNDNNNNNCYSSSSISKLFSTSSRSPKSKNLNSNTNHNQVTKRLAYHSQSRNIFENLALEEWLYENTDFQEVDVLLVWQSDPCVVVGKHQNPWIEANLPALGRDGIEIARRSSGGGTVYHDPGNLNLSFLAVRSRYNRRHNLELVVRSLTSQWDVDLSINDRDDIVVDGKHKVSGTAAKLTRNKSYHHFTLLHSVDRTKLSKSLKSPFIIKSTSDSDHGNFPSVTIDSKSTKSVPAPVQNLQTSAPDMSFDSMLDAIVHEFLHQSPIVKATSLSFVPNPIDESTYPGITDIYRRLLSWEWTYGKTPKFTVAVTVKDYNNNYDNNDISSNNNNNNIITSETTSESAIETDKSQILNQPVGIEIDIEKGKIKTFCLKVASCSTTDTNTNDDYNSGIKIKTCETVDKGNNNMKLIDVTNYFESDVSGSESGRIQFSKANLCFIRERIRTMKQNNNNNNKGDDFLDGDGELIGCCKKDVLDLIDTSVQCLIDDYL